MLTPLSRYFACLTSLMLLLGIHTGCAATGPSTDGAPRSVSVLTIGNSFAWNSTSFLPKLTEEAGIDLTVGHANIGGASMQRHATHARKFAADPTDPDGRPYYVKNLPGLTPDAPSQTRASLREALSYRKWDVVTIQQVSSQSFKPEMYEPYAKELIQLIRQTNPQARIMIHQTWAYRQDASRLANWGMTQQQMHEGLIAAYQALSDRYDLPIIPVGYAFSLARQTPMWHYTTDADFDPKTAKPGELPDQSGSLIRGYYWKTNANGKPKLVFDSIHADVSGRYLGGCVWLESIFEVDPRSIHFVPDGLSQEQAQSLRKLAHEAASRYEAAAAK